MLIGGFAGVLGLLEYIRPWQLDAGLPLSISSLNSFGLFSPIWSPYAGGSLFPFFLSSLFMLTHFRSVDRLAANTFLPYD